MSRGNARSLLGSSLQSTDVLVVVLYATAEKHDLFLNIWLHQKVWKRTQYEECHDETLAFV